MYLDEGQSFFPRAEAALKSGMPVDWDVLSKVANLSYYRIYFEEDKN